MGREIRKVPPNWTHPVQEGWGDGRLQPMHSETYEEARRNWLDGLASWDKTDEDFWEYEGNPPDRAYYRPWKDEEATWFQVWETVSEGTPVSPPFETREELVQYLVAHGDFWDQKRGKGGWSEKSARAFVFDDEWVPSFAIINGKILEARDLPGER